MSDSNPALHHRPLFLLLLLAVLAGGLYLGWQQFAPPAPPRLSDQVTRLPQPRPIADFALVDHHERPFTLARFQGQWSFVFFGYTHCPDVCPTAMLDLKRTLEAVAAAEPAVEPPQVVFVTADPERDTPAQLARFVPYFNPDFIGVTGPQDQLDQLSSQLSSLAVKVPNPDNPDNYLVDHTASILLLNPDGRLEAIFTSPHNPDTMAADYRELARYFKESS
ncbi:hypothetical protein TspCOW1_11040 [Thiohalobacter sp. COW1]|uniref:SCO family protein n=1 Tax=Thiohalobacter sp. COW1 TaxID=2795687 RepID=UPI0019169DA7|nr:SCO family protein [Thiohalobacter sp. COW1]BCO31001.1 hypothetical protein TspCOW1_11040 [Thiohalobacter sp. COW1]